MNYIEYTISGVSMQQIGNCGRIEVDHPLICGFELFADEDEDDFCMVNRIRLYLRTVQGMGEQFSEEKIKEDTKEYLWNLIVEWVCQTQPDQMEPIQLLTSTLVADNLIISSTGLVISCQTRYILIQSKNQMEGIVRDSTRKKNINTKLMEIMQMSDTILAYMALYEYLVNRVPGKNQKKLDAILQVSDFPVVERVRSGVVVKESSATFLRNRIAHDIRALDPEMYRDIKAEVKEQYVKLLRFALLVP